MSTTSNPLLSSACCPRLHKPLLSSACCLLLALAAQAVSSNHSLLQNRLLQGPTNTITKASYATLLATAAGIRERLGYPVREAQLWTADDYWSSGPFKIAERQWWWQDAVVGLATNSIPLSYWLPESVCEEFGNFVYNDDRMKIAGEEYYDGYKTIVSCTTNVQCLISFAQGENLVTKFPILYNIAPGCEYPTIIRWSNGYVLDSLAELCEDVRMAGVSIPTPSQLYSNHGWGNVTLASLCGMSQSEKDSLYAMKWGDKRLNGTWIYSVANGVSKASSRLMKHVGGVDGHDTMNQCATITRQYSWSRPMSCEVFASNVNFRVKFKPTGSPSSSVTIETNDYHNVTSQEYLLSSRSTSTYPIMSADATYTANGYETTGFFTATNFYGYEVTCTRLTYGVSISSSSSNVSATETDRWQMRFVPQIYTNGTSLVDSSVTSGQMLFLESIANYDHMYSNDIKRIDAQWIGSPRPTEWFNRKMAELVSRSILNPVFSIQSGSPYVDVNEVEKDAYISPNPFPEIVAVWIETSSGDETWYEFGYYENLATGETYMNSEEIPSRSSLAAMHTYQTRGVLDDVYFGKELFFAPYILWNQANALTP